jgi:hypothetical protein
MVLLPGDILPIDTTISGDSNYLKLTNAKKVIHTGANLIALSGNLFYFQTNGLSAASYIKSEPYLFDIAYDKLNNKLYSASFVSTFSDTDIFYRDGSYYDDFIKDLRFNSTYLPDFNQPLVTSGFNSFKSIWGIYQNNSAFLGFGVFNLDSSLGRINFSGAPTFFNTQTVPGVSAANGLDLAIIRTSGAVPSTYDRSASIDYSAIPTPSSSIYGLFLSERSTEPSINNSLTYREGVVTNTSGTYLVSMAVSGGYFNNSRPIVSGGGIGYFNNFDLRFTSLHNTVSGVGAPISNLYKDVTSTGWIDITISGIDNTNYVESLILYHNEGSTNYSKTNTGLVLSPSGIRRPYNVDDLFTYISEPRFFSAAGSGVPLNFQVYYQTTPVTSGQGNLEITTTSGTHLTVSGSSGFNIEYNFADAVTSGSKYFTLHPDVYYIANPSGTFFPTPVYFSNFSLQVQQTGALDIAFSTDVPAIGFSGIKINEIDFKARNTSTIINNLGYKVTSDVYTDTGVFIVDSALTLVGKNSNLAVDESFNAYIKIHSDIYKIPISGNAFPSSGTYTAPYANIYPSSGLFTGSIQDLCFNRTFGGFLQFLDYSDIINEIQVGTLTITGSSPSISTRQLFLDVPSWNSKSVILSEKGEKCSFYLHGNDHNTLYIASQSGNNFRIGSYSIDKTVPAFAGLNLLDTSLRAGTSETSTVVTEVISAWGDPLNAITVNYDITLGDGVINPANSNTNTSGISQTTYSVGTTPGNVTIRGTISN